MSEQFDNRFSQVADESFVGNLRDRNTHTYSLLANPTSHTFAVVSSEQLAMTLSLNGHQAMSRHGALCASTMGQSFSTRPV
jgi:hypothetical protein